MLTDTTESKMPHPTRKPTRLSLQRLRTELLANTCSVHSDGGDGSLGHAHSILSKTEYNTNSTNGTPFVIHTKPAIAAHDPKATR